MARSFDASTSVSAARLRALLRYDAESGDFTWLVARNSHGKRLQPGDIAGMVHPDGRRYIGVDRRRYAAHRLAWFYMTGEWPTEVDHRDLDPLNNRWANLRLATRSQNNANVGLKSHNTSGVKGVSWDKERQRWKAQICVNQKRFQLGRFESKEEAGAAYRAAAEKHFGDFARA